ncbi:MAG: holo-ACP synthase [Chlamydiota bacterium]
MKGVGIDIIEIARIEKAFNRHKDRFCAKIFTEQELNYCLKYPRPAPTLAGRFAAKEAIAKALGTGIGHKLSWLDMEVFHGEDGQPQVRFSLRIQNRLKQPHVLLSISHCKAHATAIAIYLQ